MRIPFIWSLFFVANIGFGAPLSIDEYLKQVRSQNPAVIGLTEQMEGSHARSKEGNLLVKPVGTLSARWIEDRKQPGMAFAIMEKTQIHSYSLGVSEQTPFGLQLKAEYDLEYGNFVNPTSTSGVPMVLPSYYASTPKIEARLPLWQNLLGSATQAQVEAQNAAASAASFAANAQLRQVLMDAELAYWQMALLRSTLNIQNSMLKRANQLKDWSDRRARMHLGDESDALQSSAAVQLRTLEIKNIETDLASASRNFNLMRGVEENVEIEGELDSIDTLASKELPARSGDRADVLAADQSRIAQMAQATLGRERNKPQLDFYGSYAWNGKKNTMSASLSDSFAANRPTTVVGVQLSAPLDFWHTSELRAAYARERVGAERTYEQKKREQEIQWNTLSQKWRDTKARLALAKELESIQLRKVDREKVRLNTGRSTSYQFIQMEQEYTQSLLGRIRIQFELLALYAQSKLYAAKSDNATGDAP